MIRDRLIQADELEGQCRDFLRLLVDATRGGNIADIDAGAFTAVRELLERISRSRGEQGFSPSETAVFVFSLKRPLFSRLQRELAKDSATLFRELWLATELLDFLDSTGWGPALAGRSCLFLLRPPAIADMKATLIPFVDAAYAAGVEHVVFLSVAGAERMKWVPHRAVEDHLARAPGSWTILRPGFFAQNFQDAYHADIVEDGRVFVPAGDGRITFIDVYDVGDAVATLFTLDGASAYARRALTLTGPDAVTFTEATRTMSEVLGRTITYTPASVPAYAWHLRTRRRLPWVQIAVQTILHTGLRRGDAEHVDPTLPQLLGRDATPLRAYFERERERWSSPQRP